VNHLLGFAIFSGVGVVSMLLARGAPRTDAVATGFKIGGPILIAVGVLILVSGLF
jgi:hypothetical protein